MLRTVIVGGGIGGLSLARELERRGLPGVVLERAAGLAPVGAGIIMNPNAMAVLEANGLAPGVRAQGVPYVGRDTFDHRGRRLATRDYRPLYTAGRLAVGALVHRAHLHECLAGGLPPETLRLAARVVTLHADRDGVSVETETGEALTGDVLVGADGIGSTVRARFFGGSAPVYLGYRSHRFVVANHDGLEHFTEFLGRGQCVGLVPIGDGQLYVWTTFNSPHESRSWALEDAEAFRALFAQFTDSRVRGAFAQLDSTERVICTDLEEVHQAPWVRGRVVLLGDSAHAISPGLGQGAGMAMEDAVVLADELLAASAGQKPLEEALASYEGRRRARVQTIGRLSRDVIERGQLSTVLACWLRNRRIRREHRAPEQTQAALTHLLSWPRPATER
jgi:2-polyprenyl-6-methoxyphenol hydroxylase-like FAD-dependent oxidoreductase